MCGRFVLLTDLQIITESFNVQNVACEYRLGNNISPGLQIAAVLSKDDQNSLVNFQWGLIPSRAKDSSIGNKMINARAERNVFSFKPSAILGLSNAISQAI